MNQPCATVGGCEKIKLADGEKRAGTVCQTNKIEPSFCCLAEYPAAEIRPVRPTKIFAPGRLEGTRRVCWGTSPLPERITARLTANWPLPSRSAPLQKAAGLSDGLEAHGDFVLLPRSFSQTISTANMVRPKTFDCRKRAASARVEQIGDESEMPEVPRAAALKVLFNLKFILRTDYA